MDHSLAYGKYTPQFEARCEANRLAYIGHPLHGATLGIDPEALATSARGEVRMSSRDFGNGHKEACVWLHKPDIDIALSRAIDWDVGIKAERGEGDIESNNVRSVRRAKKQVRHICKSLAVNSLWTLTYRQNVQNREQVLKHLDAFRRRVASVLGEWKYIAVLEKQERGALHIHFATHALPMRLVEGGIKVKSWDVMRRIWLRVIKDDGLDGSFDEAKTQKRWGAPKAIKRAGAIGSYIAGYVAKDMQESELNRKRYSASKGVEIPEAVKQAFWAETPMLTLIEAAYARVGHAITRAWYCKETQVFFVESDDS